MTFLFLSLLPTSLIVVITVCGQECGRGPEFETQRGQFWARPDFL